MWSMRLPEWAGTWGRAEEPGGGGRERSILGSPWPLKRFRSDIQRVQSVQEKAGAHAVGEGEPLQSMWSAGSGGARARGERHSGSRREGGEEQLWGDVWLSPSGARPVSGQSCVSLCLPVLLPQNSGFPASVAPASPHWLLLTPSSGWVGGSLSRRLCHCCRPREKAAAGTPRSAPVLFA